MNGIPQISFRIARIKRLFLIAQILVAIIIVNTVIADSTGTITGKVINGKTGLPPLDAKVTIVELNRQVPVYPYDGKYIVRDIPPGFYSLKVECDYYETATIDSIEVGSNLLVKQNIMLKRSPIMCIMYKPKCFQFYSNDMKDARPIISLYWRLQYANPYSTVDKLITIWAQ
jgi:hypothetical protein